jgi:hypothetical protein
LPTLGEVVGLEVEEVSLGVICEGTDLTLFRLSFLVCRQSSRACGCRPQTLCMRSVGSKSCPRVNYPNLTIDSLITCSSLWKPRETIRMKRSITPLSV